MSIQHLPPAFLNSLTATQQHQLAVLTPERKNVYLRHLHSLYVANQQNAPLQPITVQNPTQPPIPRHKRGSGPRKCNNPSCDKIVSKRNYCYKCQKRKERGLPMGPRLPSVDSVLQNIPQAPSNSPAEFTLPPLNITNSNKTQIIQPRQDSQNKEDDDKLTKLHSFVMDLAEGSEEQASKLIRGYLQKLTITPQAAPRTSFAAQQEQLKRESRYY